jgi:hypothetical protein
MHVLTASPRNIGHVTQRIQETTLITFDILRSTRYVSTAGEACPRLLSGLNRRLVRQKYRH